MSFHSTTTTKALVVLHLSQRECRQPQHARGRPGTQPAQQRNHWMEKSTQYTRDMPRRNIAEQHVAHSTHFFFFLSSTYSNWMSTGVQTTIVISRDCVPSAKRNCVGWLEEISSMNRWNYLLFVFLFFWANQMECFLPLSLREIFYQLPMEELINNSIIIRINYNHSLCMFNNNHNSTPRSNCIRKATNSSDNIFTWSIC